MAWPGNKARHIVIHVLWASLVMNILLARKLKFGVRMNIPKRLYKCYLASGSQVYILSIV